MKRKLPNLYKGIIRNNPINQKQSIIDFNDKEEIQEKEDIVSDRNINNQIKNIFSSPEFVYKADVVITTTQGNILKKTIIGRTNNSLITMDDELIDVNEISKIDFN